MEADLHLPLDTLGNSMCIFDTIKKSRVYSYIVTGFTIYWLSELLAWVYIQDLNNLTTQAVGLITALLTALCALVRFTFTFASHTPPKE